MTDFRMQNHVDTGSIVSAYQRKTQIEQEQRQAALAERDRKVNQVKDIFNQGAGLVDNLVDYSKQKQMKDAQDALASLFAERTQPVPSNTMTPAGSKFFPGMTESPTTQPYGDTPEYKDQLASLVAKINPQAVTEQVAKSASFTGEPARLSTASRPTPIALELPDGSQTLGYFDPTTKKFHLQDGTEAPATTKKSYKYDLRTDSEGNYKVISGASGRQVSNISSESDVIKSSEKGKDTQLNQLPIKTRQEFQADLSEAKKDPNFKVEFRKTLEASRMHDMLEARNFVFDQKIGLQIARTMGDAGNIAVVEASEGKESKQFVQKGVQLLETYIKTGKLTEKNREQILEAVKIMNKAALKNLDSIVTLEEERLVELYPQLERRFIRESMVGKSMSSKMQGTRETKGNNLGDGFSFRIK